MAILDFKGWKKLYEAESNASAAADLNAEVKFDFNFESGKYLESEIPIADLNNLKKELLAPIRAVRLPKYKNQKTVLKLIASTSTLGLSAALKQKLTDEGYKPTGNGNNALCEARLKTLEGIVIDLFCTKLSCTADELAQKIEIKKISKPNSGGGTTDEERKKYQYISMKLEQTGEEIPVEERITCNMAATNRSGVQANKESNYVGFNADQYLIIPAGNSVTIKLDPQSVPDMVYFKYKDTEFLTPWLGAKQYAAPSGPTTYYEKDLNDSSKYPGLKEAINAEILSCGGKLTVETALAANGGYKDGKFIVMPGPRQLRGTASEGNSGTYTFTVTKGFSLDNLTIRVFSPLAGTKFSLSASCSSPAATPAKPATTSRN